LHNIVVSIARANRENTSKNVMKKTIRLENLNLLVHEHCSRAAVAEKVGITPPEIERYFKNKHLPISDSFAREIEEKLDKPDGWMDRKNYDLKLDKYEWELLSKFRSVSDKDREIVLAVIDAIHALEVNG
jgi:transcriptional regulator with XRE-family HTH domain